MSAIGRKTSRAEVAAIVSEALRASGIDPLLVGGSVVSLYSKGRYVTHDLDFVSGAALDDVRRALEPLGFRFRGRIASHPGTEFILDFVAPPPSVGSKPIVDVKERRTRHGSFRTLTATDCVLDRLAAYYHWNDRQALEQAVLVASAQPFDLSEVHRWTRSEEQAAGARGVFAEKLARFVDQLPPRRRRAH